MCCAQPQLSSCSPCVAKRILGCHLPENTGTVPNPSFGHRFGCSWSEERWRTRRGMSRAGKHTTQVPESTPAWTTSLLRSLAAKSSAPPHLLLPGIRQCGQVERKWYWWRPFLEARWYGSSGCSQPGQEEVRVREPGSHALLSGLAIKEPEEP